MPEWDLNSNSNDWGGITNKPPILDDGQIDWSEVQNKPFISGNFTPTLTNSNNFTLSHLERSASYYKIGNLVFIAGYIHVAVPATFPGQQLEIRDLPFSAIGGQVFLGIAQTNGLATNITVVPKIESGSNKILLFQQINQAANFWQGLGINNFNQNNQFRIQFNLFYLTNS